MKSFMTNLSQIICMDYHEKTLTKIVSEYGQEIPDSQTADNPMAPRGRAAQPL